MKNLDFKKLHSNQRLLINELIKKGAEVDVVDQDIELLEITYKGKKDYLLDRFSSVSSYNAVKMSADKYLTKQLLRKNEIQVPLGDIFNYEHVEDAVKYANKIDYPVVIKPNWGSHGDFVFLNINNEKDLRKDLNFFLKERGSHSLFLIEKQFIGKEYRIFYTSKSKFAVLHRDSAHIIGDGVNSLEYLIEKENKCRENRKKRYLCPVVVDYEVEKYLSSNNIDLKYIPLKNDKVYLRSSSNLAKGGVSENFTEKAHPSVIAIAKKVLKVFKGLPCVGIDIMTTDITKKQDKGTYNILEVNSNPGLTMHMKPGKGRPVNVALYLAEVMFPEIMKK